MNKEDFYEREVLTDSEYNELATRVEECQERLNDLANSFIEVVREFMQALWVKTASTEFEVEDFTIINRFGAISVINSKVDDVQEFDLDEIDVETLYELTSCLV